VQKDKMNRQRDRRTQETPRERHTARWQKKGTRVWTTEATSAYLARAERPATKTEGRRRKKHACSNSCNHFQRNASSNTAGDMPTDQGERGRRAKQIAGLARKRPNHFHYTPLEKMGPTALRASHCGRPLRSGSAGAPSKIKGGAIDMSKRCCSM
jgi:hypothetical protein